MESESSLERGRRKHQLQRWEMFRQFRVELFKILGRELPDAENPYLKESMTAVGTKGGE